MWSLLNIPARYVKIKIWEWTYKEKNYWRDNLFRLLEKYELPVSFISKKDDITLSISLRELLLIVKLGLKSMAIHFVIFMHLMKTKGRQQQSKWRNN